MLAWEIVRHRVSSYHRAHIGEGLPVALYAFIQDNGEGFFNWCISPDAGDYMMEHPRRIPGGSSSLEQAKVDVQREAEKVVEEMAKSLGLKTSWYARVFHHYLQQNLHVIKKAVLASREHPNNPSLPPEEYIEDLEAVLKAYGKGSL